MGHDDPMQPDTAQPRNEQAGTAQPRTLLILRHAKSDWTPTDPNDHDRPLAKRGRQAAGEVATRVPPDRRPELILCSSARRAIETLAGVSSLVGEGVQVCVERDIYNADEDSLIARLRSVPTQVRSALVIGHNPGLHDLALRVTGKGDTEVVERLAANLATAGLVTLSLGGGDWSDLGTGSCRLLSYDVPRTDP